MFIRRKVGKGQTYDQAVEGFRDEQGRVRHRTVASLGRSATPEAAIFAAKRDLRRLCTRLGMLEPLAHGSTRRGEKVDRLRTRITSLTQQLERLKALSRNCAKS